MLRRAAPVSTLSRIAFALLSTLFLALMVWAVYSYVTRDHPGANDFFQRWYGTRAFWLEGRDPYSREVALEVENKLYGHLASTDPALDEYPGDFLYPFPTAVLLAPLTLGSHDVDAAYAWASAIWIVLTWAFVAAAFIAMVDLFSWRPPGWLIAVGIAWTATFYPATRGMFLGQTGVVAACLELLAIWALAKAAQTTPRFEVLAGVFLTLSTFKPQIGLLIVPFLLLWGVRFRRWYFLAGVAITGAILYGVSFLLLPSWLSEWLAQSTRYTGYTQTGSPVSIITNAIGVGHMGELIVSGLLLIPVLWAWYRVLWVGERAALVWTAALSLTVTHLILVRTATPHYVVFLIVIVFALREITRRRNGTLLAMLTLVVLTVGLWALFLLTLQNRFESPWNYLPLPIGSLLVLALTRPAWLTGSLIPTSTVHDRISQPTVTASQPSA